MSYSINSFAQKDSLFNYCRENNLIAYTLPEVVDSVIADLFDFMSVHKPEWHFLIYIHDRSYEDQGYTNVKKFGIHQLKFEFTWDSVPSERVNRFYLGNSYLSKLTNRYFVIGDKHLIPIIFQDDEYFGTFCGSPISPTNGVGSFTSFQYSMGNGRYPYDFAFGTGWKFEEIDGIKKIQLLSTYHYHKMLTPREKAIEEFMKEDSLKNE